MTTMTNFLKLKGLAIRNPWRGSRDAGVYYVVHPLYDEPEEKRDPALLGPMKLSKGERLSLFALRGYLIAMLVLAGYRVAAMAGLLAPHVR